MKQFLNYDGRAMGMVQHSTRIPRMAEHHHDEVEVNVLLAGSLTYRLGSASYRLKPHSMVWLFPSQSHLIVQASEKPVLWVGAFKIDRVLPDRSSPKFEPFRTGDPKGYFLRDLHPGVANSLGEVFQSCHAAQAAKDLPLLNAGLAYLFHKAWDEFAKAKPSARYLDLPREVSFCLDAIDEGKPDDAAALARKCGMGVRNLQRLFRDHVGLTMTEYRNRRQLERFWAIRSRSPRLSLLECATEAGFGSYPQFYRVHRSLCGTSPKESRG